tara:strand:- start:555 stop:905 length:351 start_codon:yes stop_codon:yes gene_type:complete
MSASDKKISLSEATTWTTNWRNAPSTSARAFLIPVQDLQGALTEMGNPTDPNACIRAYLGIDPSSGEEKLIIVGTEIDKSGVYRDLLPDGDGTNGNSIWDFTRPCPIFCDDQSDLN